MPELTGSYWTPDELVDMGFLWYEAETFVGITYSPAVQMMVQDRAKQYEDFIEQGGDEDEWQERVYRYYDEKNWYQIQRPDEISPWKLLDQYIDNLPATDYPWKHRSHHKRDDFNGSRNADVQTKNDRKPKGQSYGYDLA